jgi:copper chaperone CopZ
MECTETFVVSKNILVFRSNIDDTYKAAMVCTQLEKIDGVYRVNVDLDDWENILRIECDPQINEHPIRQVVSQLGYYCDEL